MYEISKQLMKYTFKFNWFEVLFYSFFITYGYFGLMTKLGAEKSLLQLVSTTIVLSLIQGLFGYLAHLKFEFANENFNISRKDLLKFSGLFLALLIVVCSQLNWAMYVDELSYANAAHVHAISGLLSGGRYLTFFANTPFKYLAQFFSFSLLVGLVFTIWLTHKFSWKFKIFTVVSLLIISRSCIYLLGGNASPHPSFELIMPFIFGVLFGLNHFAFKLAYLFSAVVFLFVLYKRLQLRFSGAVLYLSVLAVGTIPLLLHMSTIVEHSIWSGLAISYVFVELLLNEKTPYFRLMAVISLATMMRLPCFIALIPVLAHYLITHARQTSLRDIFKNLVLWNLPTLFFIPFVGKSILYGTPATQGPAAVSALLKLKLALKSPIIFIAAANSVNLWMLAFIPFVFLTWRRDFKITSLVIRFFLIAALIVFYSIHPGLWGHAKYQFEFIVPLCIAGFIMLITALNSVKKISKIITSVLVVICCVNVYAYINYQRGNKPVDELVSMTAEYSKNYDAGYRGLVTFPFNYKEAFADIEKLNVAGNTFVVGGSYGVVQEILADYTLSQAVMAHQIFKDQQGQIVKVLDDDAVVFDAERANSDSRINAILLGPIPMDVKKNAVEQLQNLGWKLYKTYSNDEYGSSLTLMLK